MRLKPILLPGVLAGTLVLPGLSLALGLGKLTVSSSLGQPLSARIELTSAAKEELDSLAARVADPSLYRQNNLGYQGVLSRSRITLERTPSGQAFLNVTTQGALTEPYLDLMVELNWASGRLVREYTFLLDPPGVAAPPVEPVTPIRSGAAAPVSAPPAAPRMAAPSPPATAPSPAAVAPSAARSAPAARASSGGEGYTVQRGDSLSKIAAEFKPQNVTMEQMLVAMYKNNQGAFDGNINRLRAGSIITVPSPEEAAATSPTEATRTVRMHADDWHGYRNRVATTAPQSAAGATRGGTGRIGTAVEETAPAAAPGRDQLRVSRVAEAGTSGAAATEDAITRNKQIKDAQDRIAELEKTVRELQRAAELKSQALAMLQAQAEAAKGGAPKSGAQTPAPSVVAEAPKGAETKAPEPKAAETKVAEPTKTASPASVEVAKSAEAPKAAEASKSVEAPKSDTTAAAKTDDAAKASMKAATKAEDASKATKTAMKSEPAPKPETSMFDDVMSKTPTWAIGAGALAVLAGIAALLAARRRKSAQYEDAIATDSDLKANTVFGATGGGVVNTGDNSLSSEFSREGLGSIDTDEVDPIAEAEVYLAYGRDAQAEEILKEALKKDPHRQEIYMKLLEIHAQHNKPSAFDAVAAELRNVSQGQGEIWERAVALGRQLDPANAMFAEAGQHAAAGGDLMADAHSFSVPPDLKPDASHLPSAAANDADNIFDRALEEDIAVSTPAKAVKPAPVSAAAAAATAQLVSGLSKGNTVGGLQPPAGNERGATSDFVSDLDFQLDDIEKPAPFRSAAAGASAGASVGAAGAAKSAAAPPAPLDKLDFAFDEHPVQIEDASPSVIDGQWHDSATKLDLAKAYQEMGDVEGAREILREVLVEGDDEQKSEAQTLIAKLGEAGNRKVGSA